MTGVQTCALPIFPRFTATARGPGKILISWHNKYPVVSQISIQRSTDSLRDFTTLITVPDPRLTVLRDTPRMFSAIRIRLTDPG